MATAIKVKRLSKAAHAIVTRLIHPRDWLYEVHLHRGRRIVNTRKYKSLEAAIRKTAERCMTADPRDLFEVVEIGTTNQVASAKVKVGGRVDLVFN